MEDGGGRKEFVLHYLTCLVSYHLQAGVGRGRHRPIAARVKHLYEAYIIRNKFIHYICSGAFLVLHPPHFALKSFHCNNLEGV